MKLKTIAKGKIVGASFIRRGGTIHVSQFHPLMLNLTFVANAGSFY